MVAVSSENSPSSPKSQNNTPAVSPSQSTFVSRPRDRTVVTVPPYAVNDPVDILDDEETSSAVDGQSLTSPPNPPSGVRDMAQTVASASPFLTTGSIVDSTPKSSAYPTAPFAAPNVQPPAIANNSTNPGSNPPQWWTFALPTKYIQRAEVYRHRLWASDDPEKSDADSECSVGVKSRSSVDFTAHHAQTPGWADPWRPSSILGGATSFGEFGRTNSNTPSQTKLRKPATWHNLRHFLLSNPFAPLIFRLLNITVTTSTLGVAIRIFLLEKSNNVMGIVGRSPLIAIIFAALTLVHVITNVYLEYFGRPIGLWPLHFKMFHTLVELIFISLWSAALSLAFDDLFSSSLECTGFQINPRFGERMGDEDLDDKEAGQLCELQEALVGLVFISLMLYAGVLVVSLFRIASRVSGN